MGIQKYRVCNGGQETGVVTGVAAGTATIEVTTQDGSHKATATVEVTAAQE
ncbi:TPA: Ig-like domain-containing protein [Escherichia coli]